MRIRHLLSAFAALFISLAAGAVPAKPGPFQYTQPDGSVVTLERHGDEFFNWTTLYGTQRVVELDENGFWRPSQISEASREAARLRRQTVGEQRLQILHTRSRSNVSMTQGSRHIPVFLVEFPDKNFSVENPADSFSAMLNQPGYSGNEGTGSVQDYFMDNSHGRFQPIFDVYGPVMLPNEMAYYGKNRSGQGTDIRPELALYDACVILADQVDFSIYDADGDGFVDMTLFYYAGYSEAEGASTNTIWPHQYTVQASSSDEARNTRFNGKRLGNYFCTAELKGTQGTKQCGIGPTCHEFSHSLGLPDFYDTDYEKNGECKGLTSFSLMDGGCYLNESRTPPYLNAEERIMLGWMAEEEVLDLTSGTVSFPAIQNNVAYISYSSVEGEYYLYECRDASGWDAYLPEGMLIYHADKSMDHRVGNTTAYDLWNNWRYSNAINAYGNHPCFYVVPAADPNNFNYKGSLSRWVFPGASNVKSFSPKDWDGNSCGVSLSSISYADGKVSISATVDNTRSIRGKIVNPGGKALSGVHIMVTKVNAQSGTSMQIPLRIARRTQEFSAYTDKDGCFEIALEGFDEASCHLTASLEGYNPYGTDVKLSKRGPTSISITLSYVGQTLFQYYDEDSNLYLCGDGESASLMASIRIPAGQLPAEGGEVTNVSFLPYWPASAYYIVIDSGKDRVLTYKLPDIPEDDLGMLRTVDLSDVVNHFPPGKDLYVGYAIQDAKVDYDEYYGFLFPIAAGSTNAYVSDFSLDSSKWESLDEEGYALVMKASIIPSGEDKPLSFAQMGIPAIADPGKGNYTTGDAFQLQMELPEGLSVSSSEWYYDGKEISGAKSVSLTAGTHTVTAVVHYTDGSTETFDLVLNVN
ncbi:MAG: M6 family metalloprotease domain-containing protein [Bacteroidales bacterium]|nr:M6 family metalloprotease domain-containing protein [Bacteroidales bacterium]